MGPLLLSLLGDPFSEVLLYITYNMYILCVCTVCVCVCAWVYVHRSSNSQYELSNFNCPKLITSVVSVSAVHYNNPFPRPVSMIL